MKEHLPEYVMWELAREIQKLGPRDHGIHRNRWGTICHRVKEARSDMDIRNQRGTGDDNKMVWDMVKHLNKQRSAA